MCCLKYEQDAYEDAVKRVPKQDSFVECPDGVGTVSAVNLLKEQVKVRLDDSTEQPKSYYTSEIRVIRSGKGKRPEDYVAPPPEELEKLRYIPPEEERRPYRMGDASVLSAALEQYLGTSAPADEEEKKSATRRRRGRGKGTKKPEGQPAAKVEPAPQPQPAPSQPRQGSKGGRPQPKRDQSAHDQPRKDQGRKDQPKKEQAKKEPAPAQPKRTQSAPRPAPAEGGEAKPANKRRHYRPRGQRPKKPGEGGGSQPNQ
jgi:hypothetical protein